jgi:uncharacterized protein
MSGAQIKRAHFRFYEELNDSLPADKRKRTFGCCFLGEVTAAQLIGAVGVPLGGIDLLLIDGAPARPEQVVRDGDRISCYPVFESLDIHAVSLVRAEPLRRPRFLLDSGLMRLVAYLRLLGFDACGVEGCGTEEAARRAEAEGRILLSRKPIPASPVGRFYRVRSCKPRRQVAEVLARLDLHRLVRPMSRCPRCNGELKRAGAALSCAGCHRTYRDGIHLKRLLWLINVVSRGR